MAEVGTEVREGAARLGGTRGEGPVPTPGVGTRPLQSIPHGVIRVTLRHKLRALV